MKINELLLTVDSTHPWRPTTTRTEKLHIHVLANEDDGFVFDYNLTSYIPTVTVLMFEWVCNLYITANREYIHTYKHSYIHTYIHTNYKFDSTPKKFIE